MLKNRRRSQRRRLNFNIARQRRAQPKILLKSGRTASKIMKIIIFKIWHKLGRICRPCTLQNSGYREARDMRLAPSDASYIIVPRTIRGSEIDFGDLEIFSINHLKRTHMSVSQKSPTSSPCTRITLYRAPLKLICSTSHYNVVAR